MSITLSKSFSPTTIVDGGITTLTFTVVVDEFEPQPVIQIFDRLPSGLAYAGDYSVPDGWIVFQVPPVGSNGVIQADGISLPNGTYTLTFDITNLPGQTNPSCEFNPPSFTNQSSNLVLLPPVFMFDGVPSCLIITDAPPMELIVEKSFSPSSILIGGVSTLTITITNPNPFPVVGIAFNDIYPSGVVTASPTNYISGGNVLPPPIPGGNNLAWFKVTGLPPLGSVTISVDVTSNTVGVYNNSTGQVTNLQIVPPVPPSDGASATLTVKASKKRRGGIGGISFSNILCFNRAWIDKYYPNSCQEGAIIHYSNYRIPYMFSHIDERGNCCFKRISQRR